MFAAGVAAAAQHHGLAMPADIRDQLQPGGSAQQRAAFALLRQRVEVADLGDRQRMADVARAAREQALALALEQRRIEVAADGKRRLRGGERFRGDAQVGHGVGEPPGVRWQSAGLTVGRQLAPLSAEGPRIVTSGLRRLPSTARGTPARTRRPGLGGRAAGKHLGPGRLTTIVVFQRLNDDRFPSRPGAGGTCQLRGGADRTRVAGGLHGGRPVAARGPARGLPARHRAPPVLPRPPRRGRAAGEGPRGRPASAVAADASRLAGRPRAPART